MAWCEALTYKRVWDVDRDRPRIREAFIKISATMNRWPQVSDLIANLPRTDELKALPRKAGDPEKARQAIEELRRHMEIDG